MDISSLPRPITASLLSEACAGTAIRHGFFTRQGGVSTGLYASLNVGLGSQDDAERVATNRTRIAAALDVAPDRLATVHQVHSPDVHVVGRDDDGTRPKADALVTDVPGIALGILTADCGPVLFADPVVGVVGAAHAGWRGAFTGVIENTIAAMEGLGADRSRIVACLGPSISGRNYEVGPEFVERFVGEASGNAHYFAPSAKSGHAYFDLPAYTLDRLTAAGVRAQNLDLCTYADEERFFSYRRTTHRGEPDYGRQISAITILQMI